MVSTSCFVIECSEYSKDKTFINKNILCVFQTFTGACEHFENLVASNPDFGFDIREVRYYSNIARPHVCDTVLRVIN